MPPDIDLILLWTKKLVTLAVLPPLAPMLIMLLGLWLARRGRRSGPGVVWCGLALMLFFTMPASVNWMLAALETAPPLTVEQSRKAQAIVILAGGQRRYAPEYGGSTVSALSLERLRYGARLARMTGLPVLVSGGTLREARAEADLMREALEQDFGVAVRWTESGSRNTRENASRSARLLANDNLQRVLLVTHAAHMPRARAEFEAAGVTVIPAPTAWQSAPSDGVELRDLIPTPRAAYGGWYAAHEWLGRLVYDVSR